VVIPRLADRVLDDIHDVFRVVSGTRHRLALSAPRQWVDRSERELSGVMLEVATALGRRGDGVGEEGDVPTAARLRAVYLNSGQNARRGAAEALPLSPRARFAAATPASVPAGWLRGGALAIDRLDELSAAFRSERLSGVDGVVTDVWDQLVPPGVAAHRPISASGL